MTGDSLFNAGAAFAMMLADNQWAKDHAWAVPWLWGMAAISMAMALASAKWFRSLFIVRESIDEKTINQSTRGSNSPATVTGDLGQGASIVVGGEIHHHHYGTGEIQKVPEVILEWISNNQFSRFRLANRSDADATNIMVSNLRHGVYRHMAFSPVDRIAAWAESDVRINLVWSDTSILKLIPSDQSRGLFRNSLLWLACGDDPFTEKPSFDTCIGVDSEVTVYFDDERGVNQFNRTFKVTFDPNSWLVTVLPKPPSSPERVM